MRCYVSAEDGGDTMFGNFITALGGIGGRQSDTRQSMHEANKPHHLNSAKGGKGMGYEGYN
ncbi:MAG: hypothetical protein LBP53_06795 [Candidatus Peribacteria bacterium]|jgi:hypothetical protein|nr:hypothetical protein [Candidatus Peribacteria bacterium]